MLVSIAEEMNPTRRNTQEDAHVVHGPGSWGAPNANAIFVGVMDGHGGRQIADYLEEHLAKNVGIEWMFAVEEENKGSGASGKVYSVEGCGNGSTRCRELQDQQLSKKRRLPDDNYYHNNKENNSNNGHFIAAATTSTASDHHPPSVKSAAAVASPSVSLDAESRIVQSALERAFLITDIQSRLDGIITSGATVACCVIVPNLASNSTGGKKIIESITIHAANAGDARAVLSSRTARHRSRQHYTSASSGNENYYNLVNNGGLFKHHHPLPSPEFFSELPLNLGTDAIRITHDHKSTDPEEISRIESAGGVIIRGRVLGVLAVARSLGDHGLKEFVIAKPHLSSTTVTFMIRPQHAEDDTVNGDIHNDKTTMVKKPFSHQDPFTDDEFLVVACDGLWDVMEDQEVVDFIRKHIRDVRSDDDAKQRREKVASFVVEEALKRGSADNITVIVYWL